MSERDCYIAWQWEISLLLKNQSVQLSCLILFISEKLEFFFSDSRASIAFDLKENRFHSEITKVLRNKLTKKQDTLFSCPFVYLYLLDRTRNTFIRKNREIVSARDNTPIHFFQQWIYARYSCPCRDVTRGGQAWRVKCRRKSKARVMSLLKNLVANGYSLLLP